MKSDAGVTVLPGERLELEALPSEQLELEALPSEQSGAGDPSERPAPGSSHATTVNSSLSPASCGRQSRLSDTAP
jgi:hypothetical protein